MSRQSMTMLTDPKAKLAKGCRKCSMLNDAGAEKCKYCGSTDLINVDLNPPWVRETEPLMKRYKGD